MSKNTSNLRSKNIALFGALCLLAGLFYLVTIVRLGAGS